MLICYVGEKYLIYQSVFPRIIFKKMSGVCKHFSDNVAPVIPTSAWHVYQVSIQQKGK